MPFYWCEIQAGFLAAVAPLRRLESLRNISRSLQMQLFSSFSSGARKGEIGQVTVEDGLLGEVQRS